MILQALAHYYDILASDPGSGVAPLGYSPANVRFALYLSAEGKLSSIIRLFEIISKGKKSKEVDQQMLIPEQLRRSGTNPAPYFLCDNCAYVLGISDRDEKQPSYSEQRFAAFRDLHIRLLSGIDCLEARAVIAFLSGHNVPDARNHPRIAEKLEELLEGGNLVFFVEDTGRFVHQVPEIRQVWETTRLSVDGGMLGQCLATGKNTTIARLHPVLKGVKNAPPMGVTLVSFNDEAYESYQKDQGENAPVSEKVAFAYGTVLNHLLSRKNEMPKFTIGDASVVYWADSPNTAYSNVFAALFDPEWSTELTISQPDKFTPGRMREIAQKVRSGEYLDTTHLMDDLDPNTKFYVLGIASNSARAAVRFFHCDLFELIVQRIITHYEDLQIERESEKQPKYLSIRSLIEETISKKSREKEALPLLSSAMMRAVLDNTMYPAILYNSILNRIRADSDDSAHGIRKINYPRAAIIKAYLTRKYRSQTYVPIKEVLCMSLNEQSSYPAYLMGRLFAVLEKAQEEAIPGINTTVKDRFFSSACTSPITVFPQLLRLSQHHIAKLNPGRKVQFERLFGSIMGGLEGGQKPFPSYLSLDDQGSFVIGYYHQRVALFTPKNSQSSNDAEPTKTDEVE